MAQTLFRIINATSGYVFHCDDGGTGNLRMYGASYNLICQNFFLEEAKGGYRIRNKETGYFVHADNDGTGNVRMYNCLNDVCQVFELEPDGDGGGFRIRNRQSRYYLHADSDGTANLRMYNQDNHICQRVVFYALTKTPLPV